MRRDNCLLVRNVVTTCLEKILIERNVSAAVEYVKGVISDLLMNKIDLSLLVISKVGGSGHLDLIALLVGLELALFVKDLYPLCTAITSR